MMRTGIRVEETENEPGLPSTSETNSYNRVITSGSSE